MLNLARNVNRRLSKALIAKHLQSTAVQSNRNVTAGPLSFQLTDEQNELVESARKFVREVVIPNAAKWDRNNEYPVEAHKQAHMSSAFSLPAYRPNMVVSV